MIANRPQTWCQEDGRIESCDNSDHDWKSKFLNGRNTNHSYHENHNESCQRCQNRTHHGFFDRTVCNFGIADFFVVLTSNLQTVANSVEDNDCVVDRISQNCDKSCNKCRIDLNSEDKHHRCRHQSVMEKWQNCCQTA